MRWLGIIALSLLALVPLCSSDGNQSNTTALPSANPLANDEIYDISSLLNSTGISTIMFDAEASPTASAIDPSIGNSSTVISVMQEEQGSEIEFSSTQNALEPTPSWEDDEDVENDEAASSEADDVEAEPSRSSGVESQPQSVESPPSQATNSSETENLSANDLQIQLNAAHKSLEEAKKAIEKERDELAKREKATEQPNKDYEEKKKEWEKLEAIAVEKETADREYKQAQKNLSNILLHFLVAETAFNKTTGEIKDQETLLNEIDKWPDQKRRAESNKQLKAGEEQPLIVKGVHLQIDADTKNTEWITAEKKVNDSQKLYDQNNCDDPAQASSTLCNGFRESIVELKGETKLAKDAYDQAASNLKAAETDLENLRKELSDLETEIDGYTLKIAKITKDSVNNKIQELKKELEDKSEIYNIEQKKKEDAEAELNKKKTAKEAAEQTDGGISAEASRNEAITAKVIMGQAKKAKKKADKQVEDQKKILENAEQNEAAAKANVEKLEKAYAEALKEEEARRREAMKTGSGVGLGVGLGIGGLVLLIGVGIAVYIYYKKCYKKKKPMRGARATNTAGPGETDQLLPPPQGTSATTLSSNKANLSDQGSAQQNGQQPSNVLMACLNSCNEEKKNPADIKPGETPAPNVTDQPGGLPDLSVTPFIPGEEPFKIPAKNFKWKGPLIRRSRWHGEPKHLLEGKKGPEKLDKIWFDPNANYATEIGATEIMEDGGPPSDSNRSEWLNNLDEWEKGRKAMLAAEAAAKNGGKPDHTGSENSQKTDAAKGKEKQTELPPLKKETKIGITKGAADKKPASSSKKTPSTEPLIPKSKGEEVKLGGMQLAKTPL